MAEWTGRVRRRFGLGLLAAGSVLTGLSCGGEDIAAPSTGSIEITTVTSGAEPDGNDYAVTIDGGAETAIGANSTLRRDDLQPGSHTVQLTGMASNCVVQGENPRTLEVRSGEPAPVEFMISCTATTGRLEISTSTAGPGPDLDGYTLILDGAEHGAIGASGTMVAPGLTDGDHSVGLSGVAANCQVQGDNPRLVTVIAGASATVALVVSCTAPPTAAGTVRVATSTTGVDLDLNGYAVALDGATTQPVGVNAVLTLTNVAAGAHTLQFSGVAGNCSASGTNPRAISVTAGETATVAFEVTCVATNGTIRVSVTTSGSPVDPNGYMAKLDDLDPGLSIESTGFASFTAVPAGDHTVTLADVASNCSITGGASQPITVATGDTSELDFVVTCTTHTGDLEISTTTTGDNPDPDGYTTTVDDGSAQAIGTNGTLPIPALAPGTHRVTLAGLARNCSVQGVNPLDVTVSAGQKAAATFAVLCTAVLVTYRAIDLGTLGGAYSTARAINSAGQVVGSAGLPGGDPENGLPNAHAFLWENGVMTDLGTLGGGYSSAEDINDAGQVVGYSTTGSGVTHGFRWDKGVMTDLGSLGGDVSDAMGINPAGQVVGTSYTPILPISGGHPRAYLWQAGVMTNLGTLGGNASFATDINDQGQVVGHSEISGPNSGFHAFLWENGVMLDLGNSNEATGINSAGQVVGNNFGGHAFLWEKGVRTDLGTLGGSWSRADGINSAGQVVGASPTAQGFDRGFVWEKGVMTELGTLGGGFSGASDINDEGQVVGYSNPATGLQHATLWIRE